MREHIEEWAEQRTKGRIATAYCIEAADAQALIDYADLHGFYLEKVLRECGDNSHPFDERHTGRSLCEFLEAGGPLDHVIISSADVFISTLDLLNFVWLCKAAHVKIHFLRRTRRRLWRFILAAF